MTRVSCIAGDLHGSIDQDRRRGIERVRIGNWLLAITGITVLTASHHRLRNQNKNRQEKCRRVRKLTERGKNSVIAPACRCCEVSSKNEIIVLTWKGMASEAWRCFSVDNASAQRYSDERDVPLIRRSDGRLPIQSSGKNGLPSTTEKKTATGHQ